MSSWNLSRAFLRSSAFNSIEIFFLSHKICKINFCCGIRKSGFLWHLYKKINVSFLRFLLTCNVNFCICHFRHCRKKQVQNSGEVNPRQLQKFSYLIFYFLSSLQKTIYYDFVLMLYKTQAISDINKRVQF